MCTSKDHKGNKGMSKMSKVLWYWICFKNRKQTIRSRTDSLSYCGAWIVEAANNSKRLQSEVPGSRVSHLNLNPQISVKWSCGAFSEQLDSGWTEWRSDGWRLAFISKRNVNVQQVGQVNAELLVSCCFCLLTVCGCWLVMIEYTDWRLVAPLLCDLAPPLCYLPAAI